MGSPGCDANRSNSVQRSTFPTKNLVPLEPGLGNLARWISAAPGSRRVLAHLPVHEGAQFKTRFSELGTTTAVYRRRRRGDADYKAQQAYEMTVITIWLRMAAATGQCQARIRLAR